MTFTCTGIAFIVVQMTCTTIETPPAVVCPPVRTWTKEFRTQVAAEMRAAPNSALAQMAIDYIGDRDVARACARSRKAK